MAKPDMTPEDFRNLTRSELRRLARKGVLIDTAFKVFRRTVYPDAGPDQVAAMRTCFFAGAAEVHAMTTAGLDEGAEETDGDLEFMAGWVDEIERFHRRTIAAMTADERQGRH